MLQSSEDAARFLAEGRSLFGEGWKYVSSFDDVAQDADEEEEFEYEEEEMFVTLDLGTTLDSKALQTENQYQLIGLDTPLPFLKIGNQIFQGEVTPLIGDEVILDLVRNHDNPQIPSHPPIGATNHRLTFRAVTLEPRPDPAITANQTRPSAVSKHSTGNDIFAAPGPASSSSVGAPSGSGAGGNTPQSGGLVRTTAGVTSEGQTTRPVAEVSGSTGTGPESQAPAAGPSTSPLSLSSHPFFAPPPANQAEMSTLAHGLSKGGSTGAGKGKSSGAGKGRGRWREKIVLDDPKELESLNLDDRPGQSFELGPKVLEHLGLPPSIHGEGVPVTRREMERVLSGLPYSGEGSRGGKGKKTKRERELEKLLASQDAGAGAEVGAGQGKKPAGEEIRTRVEMSRSEDRGEGQGGAGGEGMEIDSEAAAQSTAIVQQEAQASAEASAEGHDSRGIGAPAEEDTDMIDVEDDPPWQEVGQNEVP